MCIFLLSLSDRCTWSNNTDGISPLPTAHMWCDLVMGKSPWRSLSNCCISSCVRPGSESPPRILFTRTSITSLLLGFGALFFSSGVCLMYVVNFIKRFAAGTNAILSLYCLFPCSVWNLCKCVKLVV